MAHDRTILLDVYSAVADNFAMTRHSPSGMKSKCYEGPNVGWSHPSNAIWLRAWIQMVGRWSASRQPRAEKDPPSG